LRARPKWTTAIPICEADDIEAAQDDHSIGKNFDIIKVQTASIFDMLPYILVQK